MDYFSHSTTDLNGITRGSKTLFEHIQGISEKIKATHSDQIDFGIGKETISHVTENLAKFHDFGKFTTYFQNYLLKKQAVDPVLKQHARIGGIVAYNKLVNYNEKLALICLYIIFRHHGQLNNITGFSSVFDDNFLRIFELQKKDICGRIKQIETHLKAEGLERYLVFPDERQIRRSLKIWQLKEPNIRDYFLINYLFSLLIESDKLDASNTQIYSLKKIEKSSVDIRFGVPQMAIISKDGVSTNELRNFCRAEVVSHLNNPDILKHGVFTLTAPTGIGKTMTALDFALKLKSKIREKNNTEARIIYALPFINIIEQALKEYVKTLPEDVKVLGHYQFADVFGEEKENGSDSVVNYAQRLMLLDTWQADIVITSFVQFFETLIGNRNKLLKKFNHFANAIIILDEVQTLRIEQMPLIGAALYYLSKYLNARILLMTATKPKIFELAQKEILSDEGDIVKPFELLTSHKEVFSRFKRTKIFPLFQHTLESETLSEDFIREIFAQRWTPDKSCIIVCNTVNRSIELFRAIQDYIDSNKLKNPVACLSTNIIPVHRFGRIQQIKEWLKGGKAPVLVSTQVVEAGVDLDFDMGFRDLGPIDSIIQVAGRINRNNDPRKTHSPLFIVDFGDARKIYGAITEAQSLQALKAKSEIPEEDYLEMVDTYFDHIAQRNSFARYNKVFESMKRLRYDSEYPETDMPVSDFKIIEESRMSRSVFIEYDETASDLKGKYLEKMSGKMLKEVFDQYYKLAFQQHIIAVPEYLTGGFEAISEYDQNLLCLDHELVAQHYDQETGLIRRHTNKVVML